MKAEHLRVGCKYIPHSKRKGAESLDRSKVWRQAQEINQPFLYFTGSDDEDLVFNHTYEVGKVDGDFYLAEDVTPYFEAGQLVKCIGLREKKVHCWAEAFKIGNHYTIEGISEQGNLCVRGDNGTRFCDPDQFIPTTSTSSSQKTKNNMKQPAKTTQTITRTGLHEIYKQVCSTWQGRIEEALKENLFSDTIEVSDEILTAAYDSASSIQAGILNVYFTRPINDTIKACDLAIGEMMTVSQKGKYEGLVLVRTYNEIVCLSNVRATWDTTITIKGKRVEKGTHVPVVAK
jgi:hypothetical protein